MISLLTRISTGDGGRYFNPDAIDPSLTEKPPIRFLMGGSNPFSESSLAEAN